MFCLLTEMYWSVHEVNLKQSWRVFTVIFIKSPVSIILKIGMFFPQPHRKWQMP
jgi:hypothetical protein